LRDVGASGVSSFNVGEPDFFQHVDVELSAVSIADWRTYLRWHLVRAVAATLPAKFVSENFDFYGRTLTGSEENLPRWQRCVQSTDNQLGEALGQYYVQRYFPPEAKAKALVMVENLVAALRADLATLDWMSPATREKAIEKLGTLTFKIGYPDKWRDYSKYEVGRGPYADNYFRGNTFEFDRDLAKIGKPVDRTEWDMTPPTVNAENGSSWNEIVFPAGILQPPYFDPNRDDALNYGDMGGVIGHEMTHSFDNAGAKYDAHGNLKNWWTPEDLKNFEDRGKCIAKQFDAFEVEPGLHANGELEEGESIADLGGLVMAYAAFHKSLDGKPEPAPIDGFTADQRFFLAYAEGWATQFRPEFARLLANTNEHPLDKFRTLGPLSNMPEFARAFQCSTKAPMVRPEGERCRIW
jgi:predicted metalloendopeptidase